MKTIMIVDDEVAILEMVKTYLESNEVDVLTANNSRQALEILGKGENIDLILIDTPMPGEDATALYPMKPNSKLTTTDMKSFLPKPFTKEQLINFIKERI
jgi:DNA-binding NtrC family response regulator